MMKVPKTREEFLRQLYESERYRHALASARSEEERRMIATFVTDLVGNMADIVCPIAASAMADGSVIEALEASASQSQSVVNVAGRSTSGSAGSR